MNEIEKQTLPLVLVTHTLPEGAPSSARWRSHTSASVIASIASATGTTRGQMHGSWRPPISIVVVPPPAVAAVCGLPIEVAGRTATRTTTSAPFEIPPCVPAVELAEGGEVRFGEICLSVLHTPGHTEGSVCLWSADEGLLFSGDTLFASGWGRTDLPGGSYETILSSLHERVLALPDETLVVPGHGPLTTIGRERETNPFLIHR